MQLIDIVLFLYIILVIIGLILLWQKLSEALFKLPNLTQEQRILIIVAVFAIITFATFYVGLKIHERRKPPAPVAEVASTTQQPTPTSTNPEVAGSNAPIPTLVTTPAPTDGLGTASGQTLPLTSDQGLTGFLQLNYPDLNQQRNALMQTIQRFDTFFARADQLAAKSPKHYRFMQEIAVNRWRFRQDLVALQTKIETELQTFWIFYQNGSSDYTQQEFAKRAVILEDEIQSALGKESDMRTKETNLLHNYQTYLIKVLNKPPPKLGQRVEPLTAENEASVRKWLQDSGQNIILQNLAVLKDSQSRIQNSLNQFKNFATQYPSASLQQTIALWNQALQANIYVQTRILMVEDAEHLFTDSVMNLAPEIGQNLHLTLLERIPGLISEAADIRMQAERSYKPDIPTKPRSRNQ